MWLKTGQKNSKAQTKKSVWLTVNWNWFGAETEGGLDFRPGFIRTPHSSSLQHYRRPPAPSVGHGRKEKLHKSKQEQMQLFERFTCQFVIRLFWICFVSAAHECYRQSHVSERPSSPYSTSTWSSAEFHISAHAGDATLTTINLGVMFTVMDYFTRAGFECLQVDLGSVTKITETNGFLIYEEI